MLFLFEVFAMRDNGECGQMWMSSKPSKFENPLLVFQRGSALKFLALK